MHRRLAWFGLVAAAYNAACLDLEPIRSGRGSTDAGAATGDAASDRTCESCLRARAAARSGCVAELDACTDDPGCNELLECLWDADCFEAHGSQDQNVCAVPCALEVGVTAPDEPRVLRVLALSACGARECPDVCY